MQTPEPNCVLSTHIAFEDIGIGLAQINHDETIENVGKLPVHVEAEQLSANFGILPQKNRKTFAVGFDIGDRFGKFIEIAERAIDSRVIDISKRRRAKGIAGRDEFGKRVFLDSRFIKVEPISEDRFQGAFELRRKLSGRRFRSRT